MCSSEKPTSTFFPVFLKALRTSPASVIKPRAPEVQRLRLCLHFTGEHFVSTIKAIPYGMKSKGLGQTVYTHQNRVGAVGQEGLVHPRINPNRYPRIFSTLSVAPVLASCIFTPAIRNICSHWTKVRHRTYPICDAPLSRSAQRGTAQRRYVTEMRLEITVLMCE